MKKIGYWILSLTGGGLMTFVGLLTALFIGIFMRKKAHFHKNGYGFIIEIGSKGGGVNLGPVSLCAAYSQKDGGCYSPSAFEHTRRHEFGHSIQNIILGPFYIFIVAIPSAIRYGYAVIAESHGKKFASDGYDSIGFEGGASSGGTKAINKIENIKVN